MMYGVTRLMESLIETGKYLEFTCMIVSEMIFKKMCKLVAPEKIQKMLLD